MSKPSKKVEAIRRAAILARCLHGNAEYIESYAALVAEGRGSLQELEALTRGWEEHLTKAQGANRRGKRG